MANSVTFYCIHEGFYAGISDRLESLKTACHQAGIQFMALNALDIDYSHLPILTTKDGLYNVARGGEVMESLLLQFEPKTFYLNRPLYVENNKDTTKYSILLDKFDIPSPKTIYSHSNDPNRLLQSVTRLNGFPVILKTRGESTGIGTMLLSDQFSLLSVVDYLNNKKVSYILREYLQPKEVARFIVIGNQVVASNVKNIPDHDFRTSVKNQLPVHKRYPAEVEELAIQAAKASNFANAGIDILIDKQNHAYVLEVNMPHDFTTTEKATGIPVAQQMVKWLFS